MTTTIGTPILWPLLTAGCCSEVIYAINVQIGTPNGRYSEVVVSSGLTVLVSLQGKVYKFLFKNL